ncbi:MAG: metal ABC transporter permease [Anaerolineae bacterium]|nr:metal ABC transporter permease [Anaerolineae bacterium]
MQAHIETGYQQLVDIFLQQALLDPLSVPFMQRALIAVALTGIVCGVMGAYVVTRGMAFLGDAMAHAIVPGVALSYIATGGALGAVTLGGLGAAVFAAVFIGWLTRGRRLSEDTAIGVVFAGMLALGIAIISTTRNYSTDLTHLLIGNVLAVTPDDVALIAFVAVTVLVIVALLYKEMLVISFDPILARVLRLPAERLRLLLLVLLAVTVVISLQTVGVAMVVSLLVTPAATARFFARRMHTLMALSALIGAAGSAFGMFITWHLRIAPSAGIVLTLTAIFLLAFLFAPRGGFIWGVLRRAEAGT